MSNSLALIPPAINVIVTGLLASVILRQYINRHRIYQLYWCIGLCMAFLATLAYICLLLLQPTSNVGIMCFRIYYTLGATVMPSWLGLGSLALVGNRYIIRIIFIVLCILSLISAFFVFTAKINMEKLRHIAGTAGAGTLQPGAWLSTTILLNSLGATAVAGVALYSGWKLIRRQTTLAGLRTSSILLANIFIFTGAILNGVAGSLARFFGLENIFWLIMALGWIILFIGILLANKRSHATRSSSKTGQGAAYS
jgi:hypothetical protein